MLLKGLEEHDMQLYQMLQASAHEIVIPVVLWTDRHHSTGGTHTTGTASRPGITMEDLRREVGTAPTNKGTVRLVLIAMEGTWNHARHMVTKLPDSIRSLSLHESDLFAWRRRGDDTVVCPVPPLRCCTRYGNKPNGPGQPRIPTPQ